MKFIKILIGVFPTSLLFNCAVPTLVKLGINILKVY